METVREERVRTRYSRQRLKDECEIQLPKQRKWSGDQATPDTLPAKYSKRGQSSMNLDLEVLHTLTQEVKDEANRTTSAKSRNANL